MRRLPLPPCVVVWCCCFLVLQLNSYTNRGVLVSFNDFSWFFTIFIVFQWFSTILNAGNTPAVPRQYHGVSGSSGAVFGGPEAKNSHIYTMDLRAICMDCWASALLTKLNSPIYTMDLGGQISRLERHLFRDKIPYIYYGFGGPAADKSPI